MNRFMGCYARGLFSVILLFTSIAQGGNHSNGLNHCGVTKIMMNDYEPSVFYPTNNLLRQTGQTAIYCGEKIIVYGRVLDKNCVPVSDAKVYAWSANCNGKYPYKPLKTRIDKNLTEVDEHLTFTGNGTATTNNKGEFYFITTYPPAMHGYSSHVNVRVEHYMLGSLQTRLTLSGKKIENTQENPELNIIADQSGTNIYDFEITLPGSSVKHY